MTNNKKHNKLIQSAGNHIGSSETTRQLSDNENFDERKLDADFISWLAGDEDGNFDLRSYRSFLSAGKIGGSSLRCIDATL